MYDVLSLKRLHSVLNLVEEQLSFYAFKKYNVEELLNYETMRYYSNHTIKLHKERDAIIKEINQYSRWVKFLYYIFK